MVKYKIKYISILVVIFTLALTPFTTHPVTTKAANTLQYLLDQLSNELETKKDEIKKLETDANKYKNLIEQKRKEINSLKKEVGILETEISKVSTDIKKTGTQIDATNIEIKNTETDIIRYEGEIKNQKMVLAYLLIDMYEKTQDSDLEIFLRNDNLSEYYNNKEYVDNIENNTKGTLDNLKDIKFNLEKTKTRLDSKKNELGELKKTLQAQKSLLDDKKEEKDSLLVSTQGKEKKYQQIKSDLEKKQQEAQKEIYDLEEKIKATFKPKNLPSPGSGVLSWPVVNPVVTQGYGCLETDFAKRSYPSCNNGKGGYHNGTDFRAPMGEGLLAAGDGIITAIGNDGDYTYGKWILIKHNNGLSTLYGHLSRQIVSAGDIVKKGEIIGLAGSTGYSTGSHLHFTVYASESIKLVSSRHGNIIPIGSHYNPMLYL